MPSGRKQKEVEFFNLLKEFSGKSSTTDFARACGLQIPNTQSYLAGAKLPGKKVLIKSVQNLFGWPITALHEIEPIPENLNKVPKGKGVYVLYDSGGNVIYIGKATNFRNEIRQTLTRRIPEPIRFGPKLIKGNPLIKSLAKHYSLYEIPHERTKHNIEVLLLRVFANQTHNTNIGKFQK